MNFKEFHKRAFRRNHKVQKVMVSKEAITFIFVHSLHMLAKIQNNAKLPRIYTYKLFIFVLYIRFALINVVLL